MLLARCDCKLAIFIENDDCGGDVVSRSIIINSLYNADLITVEQIRTCYPNYYIEQYNISDNAATTHNKITNFFGLLRRRLSYHDAENYEMKLITAMAKADIISVSDLDHIIAQNRERQYVRISELENRISELEEINGQLRDKIIELEKYI